MTDERSNQRSIGGYSVLGSQSGGHSADVIRLERTELPSLRAPVDLARAPAFAFGAVRVDPATRQVVLADGSTQTLEPRVMEVLVALQRAGGAILSRDDLIAACWRGMVVGEDAIQRVIQRLRKLATASGGAFRIETITKVGYRLLVDAPVGEGSAATTDGLAADAPTVPRRRRLLLAALLAVVMAVAGVAMWRTWFPAAEPSPHLSLAATDLTAGGLPAGAGGTIDAALREELSGADVPLATGTAELTLATTLRREGAMMRLSARLDHRASGRTVWTGSQVFAADDGGLRGGAAWLGHVVGCGFSRLRDDSAAAAGPVFPLAMQECAAEPADFPRRLQLGREMVAADPASPLGHFAVAYAFAPLIRQPGPDRAALMAEGKAALARYRELRPDTADGLAQQALVAIDAPAAEREGWLRDAVEARFVRCRCPLQFLGDLLLQGGRTGEAARFYARGLDQDPGDQIAMLRMLTAAEMRGLTGTADRLVAELETLPRGIAAARQAALTLALWRGDGAAIRRAAADLPRSNDAWSLALHGALEALDGGSDAQRRAAAAALGAVPADQRNDTVAVELYAALGDTDRALGLIEDNRARGGVFAAPAGMVGSPLPLAWSPALRTVRRDPRFARYLDRAGFFTYWPATGSRPDECTAGDLPSYCARLD